MRNSIKINVNGDVRELDVHPGDTLLEALRDKLGVKSPKCGCDMGDCGSCTVMLDGFSVRSCLVLAVEADGRAVTTVEGLGRGGLTDLQEAFIRHNSFQCGFCAPGMVMAATELLDDNPDPSEGQVREAIAGNLCRCTGYEPIVRAILECARERRRVTLKGVSDGG